MSDKERKKKDGQNKDKKNKAMREAVKARNDEARPARPTIQQPARAARN